MDENEVFDDACDLGQFFVNPCYFLFVQLEKVCCKNNSNKNTSKSNKTNVGSSISSSGGGGDGEDLDYYDSAGNRSNKTNKGRMKLTPRVQQCIYILGVYGVWIIIFLRFYPLQAIHNDTIPDIHRTLGYIAFGSCLVTWIIASLAPPGDITPGTLSIYDNYAYDNVLYSDDHVCPTLQIRKLARSKFDRYTQRQVPRFDHFCGWLNQAIGEDNYRHFLAFLTVHAFACAYGSIMTGWIFWASCGSSSTSTIAAATSTANPYYNPLLAVVVWALYVVAVMLLAFWAFHIRNIARGMTTNEYYKWENKKQNQPNHQYRGGPSTSLIESSSSSSTTSTTKTTSSSTSPSRNNNKNIYDLGVWRNFQEILFPRSTAAKKKQV